LRQRLLLTGYSPSRQAAIGQKQSGVTGKKLTGLCRSLRATLDWLPHSACLSAQEDLIKRLTQPLINIR